MELTQPGWSLALAGAEEGAGQGKGQRRSGMADERGRTLGGQDAWGAWSSTTTAWAQPAEARRARDRGEGRSEAKAHWGGRGSGSEGSRRTSGTAVTKRRQAVEEEEAVRRGEAPATRWPR